MTPFYADPYVDAAQQHLNGVCRLCGGSGFLRRGMVVHELDGDRVEWVASLVSCSHPKTSATVAGEPTEHRASAVRAVGGVHGGGAGGSAGASEAVPPVPPVPGGAA